MKYIADFSDWQTGIDISEVAIHFDGIIVKALEGETIQECWNGYIASAEECGMQWGVYVYTRASTPGDAVNEARLIISLLRNHQTPALGIWFDIESPEIVGEKGGMPYSHEQITAIASAFIAECNAEGYQAGIYAPEWVLRDRLNPDVLASYVPYWISAPGCAACPQIPGITNVIGWQYRVDDYPISGYFVDANEWYE